MKTAKEFFYDCASTVDPESMTMREIAEVICDHVGDWERAPKIECPECGGTGRTGVGPHCWRVCHVCMGLGRLADE